MIRPIVTYGSETWVLDSYICNRLNIFERKVLRRILGAVCIDNIWRRRYNKELIQLLGDPDIVSNVRLGRLRWIGHINRMSNNRKVKQIFKSQPQGTRLRGRPKNRWWDCVRQDLEKCKIKNWEQLSMDRDVWRRLIEEAKVLIGL